MRQFLLPADWDGGATFLVQGDKARYLSRVLRLGPGDEFPAISRRGERLRCRIERVGGEGILLGILGPSSAVPEASLPDLRSRASRGRGSPSGASPGRGARRGEAPPDGASTSFAQRGTPSDGLQPPPPALPSIVLVQALPKAQKMDLVVRQAAEAGVAAVIPLRAGLGGGAPGAESRRERWARIAGEALQQSGSPVPTRIEDPATLEELPAALDLAFASSTPALRRRGGLRLSLLLDPAPLARDSLHGYLTDAPDEIALCVGPEGGFAPEEARALAEMGFRPLRLACAILRTETAALYAVAAVETILAERWSWIPKRD